MSLLTLPLRKEAYLESALSEFLSEDKVLSPLKSHAHLEGEYLVREVMDAIDLHVAALEALHGAASEMAQDEWAEHEQSLQVGLRELLQRGKVLASQEDLPRRDQARLGDHIRQVEYEVLWSVADPDNAVKLQRMVRKSGEDYEAGKWVEGGWDD